MLIYPPVRGYDQHGSGRYRARRNDGRRHHGVDVACYAGSLITSLTDGRVTKIGYPYDPTHPRKGHLRYVEVTQDDSGRRFRYFYVRPVVPDIGLNIAVGDPITAGEIIGQSQGLQPIYPGMVDHVHLEIIGPDGAFQDPSPFASTVAVNGDGHLLEA